MNLKENAILMKSQTFGVEIEMGRIEKDTARDIVKKYYEDKYNVTCEASRNYDDYNSFFTTDNKGRKWRFMNDGSSSGRLGSISCEMVTPILKYEDDIEDLQAIVRLLRQNGARSGADFNAGVHIHIGANFDEDGGQNAKTIRNLVNIMKSHERILLRSVGVSEVRLRWCKCVNIDFLNRINNKKPKTKDELGVVWYGSQSNYEYAVTRHYDDTRYHMLNLHATFTKGTIEFRLFEFKKGLHAGELKSWIQLCLALCSYAKLVKYASFKEINMNNEKYAMKNWLNNMGFIGDEFKTARKMLTKRLNGDTAYRNGRPSTDEDDLLDTQSYQMRTY